MNNMNNNSIFRAIADYWNDQLNNEIYFLDKHHNIKRNTKQYFDIIISQRKKYMYYWNIITSFLGINGSNKKLLEVGCGMGTDLLLFAKQGYDVYGIDLAGEHVELARNCFRLYGYNANINLGNAENLNFKDSYFDRVYSHGVIHHTQNPQKAIDEIHRVLKPGGNAYIMLYHKKSLNNFAHYLLRYPFENPKKSSKIAMDAPFTYRFTKNEIRMF